MHARGGKLNIAGGRVAKKSCARPRRAAVPAIGELAFEMFAAACAIPRRLWITCRGAAQKPLQQRIGAREFAIIHHAYFAQIAGQVTHGAQQVFAAYHGVNTLRFEITAKQMGFGNIARGIERLHAHILARRPVQWRCCCMVKYNHMILFHV